MSFLSGLGKVLSVAAPIVAAPFTGGASLLAGAPSWIGRAGQIAGAVGPVLQGLTEGRSQGKLNDLNAAVLQGQLTGDRAQTEARLYEAILSSILAQGRMGQEKAAFERDSPDVRFRQAMRGDLAANFTPYTAQVPDRLKPYMVNIQGGPQLSDAGRAAAANYRDLGAANLGKDTYNVPNLPPPPQLPPMPDMPNLQAGWLDKLLGIGGAAAGTLGALGPILSRPAPAPTQTGGILNPDLLKPNLSSGLVAPRDPTLFARYPMARF